MNNAFFVLVPSSPFCNPIHFTIVSDSGRKVSNKKRLSVWRSPTLCALHYHQTLIWLLDSLHYSFHCPVSNNRYRLVLYDFSSCTLSLSLSPNSVVHFAWSATVLGSKQGGTVATESRVLLLMFYDECCEPWHAFSGWFLTRGAYRLWHEAHLTPDIPVAVLIHSDIRNLFKRRCGSCQVGCSRKWRCNNLYQTARQASIHPAWLMALPLLMLQVLNYTHKM